MSSMNDKKVSKEKCLFVVVGVVLVVYAFYKATLGIHCDEVYSVALADMLERRNLMFKECWSALQTAAIFAIPFVHIWKALTGGTEGMLLFLRIVALLINGGVTFYFYSTFSKKYRRAYVIIASMLLFMYIPDFQSFTYKQLMIWGAVLESCFVYNYYQTGRLRNIVGLGLAMSISVLSYPTTVIQFFAFLILLMIYPYQYYLRTPTKSAEQKRKGSAALVLVASCVGCAMLFLWGVLSRISFDDLLRNIAQVYMDENLDTQFITKLWHPLWKYIVLGIMTIGPLVLCGKVRILREICEKFSIPILALLFVLAFLGQCYVERSNPTWHCITYAYSLTYFSSMLICIGRGMKISSEKRKDLLCVFIIPAWVLLISIALASNQGNATSMYASIISVLGFVLISGESYNCDEEEFRFGSLRVAVGVLLFIGTVMFIIPVYENEATISEEAVNRSVFTRREMIKEGPAAGLKIGDYSYSSYMKIAHMIRQYILEDDKLLIVDDFYTAPFGYLMNDTQYGVYSPQGGANIELSERVVEYYDENIGKEPTVILVNQQYVDDYTSMPFDEWKVKSPLGKYIAKRKMTEIAVDGEYVVYR